MAAAGHLADPVPVRDDEAVETDLVLQRAGQQGLVAVQLAVVLPGVGVLPAVERRHHRLRAGADRAEVAGAMDVDQVGQAGLRHALVRTIGGPAVADEVLDAGDRVDIVVEAALQAARVAGGLPAPTPRILRPALPRTPPAR